MNTSIKYIIMMLLLVVTLQSCNQDPTLQRYYVDSELAPGFTSLDIPVSMLNIDESKLDEVELEAYESVDKLSLLAYVLNENNADGFELEMAKVKTILKHPKYEELMRGSTDDGNFVVKFIGEEDNIEEFIVMGSASNQGFAVARVLGDDMTVNKIMTLAKVFENADIDQSQLQEFTGFFK